MKNAVINMPSSAGLNPVPIAVWKSVLVKRTATLIRSKYPVTTRQSKTEAINQRLMLIGAADASAAAGGCGVLSDEDRVLLRWRLPAIVGGKCRRKPLLDEVRSVCKYDLQPFLLQVLPFRFPESEFSAKIRPSESIKDVVDAPHQESRL